MAKIIFDSEKELEDYIFNRLSDDRYCFITDQDCDYFYRQLRLGAYGIADLVTINLQPLGDSMAVYVDIIEFKKDLIGADAVGQICRYMRAIEHFSLLNDWSDDVYVKGYLVGTGISKSDDTAFLCDCIPNLEYIEVNCSLEQGFNCDSLSGWAKTDCKFENILEKSFSIKKDLIKSLASFRKYMKEIQKEKILKSNGS